MGAPTRNMRQIWGGSASVQSEELTAAVDDLQADLQALIQDLRRGPVAEMRRETEGYLSELRREFLRSHRRLQVLMRSPEAADEIRDALRREVAEVASRSRTVILSRSSRVQHVGWTPQGLVAAVHNAVEALPRLVSAPYEARTLEPRREDGVLRAWRRRLLQAGRWIRKAVGKAQPERSVELRELARFHLEGQAAARVEGLTALLIQCEVQLAGRSRLLLEAIVQGFEALVAHVEQVDLPDMLAGMRDQIDDEFSSVEREINQLLDDSVHRAETIFGEALRALKDELPVVATIDLPARQRRSAAVVQEAQRTLTDLSARLERLREQAAASYVLLALHLELVSFRSRVQLTMDDVLADLQADVRGRSRVQIERVRAAVDEVRDRLTALEASARAADDAEVRARVTPLEHVVEEATGVTRQLLDQLSAETSVAPLLEALNREAQGLTNRYRVPASRIPRAEWKLPTPVTLVEIDFAAVVSSYVQRDVAPELLSTTNRAMQRVLPILDVFQDLERVVSFNAETVDDRWALSKPSTPAGERLVDIMQATLLRSREALTDRLEQLGRWDEDLVADIRRIVVAKLGELRSRLAEGDIGRARVARRPEPALEWTGLLDRSAHAIRGLRRGWSTWLKARVGDARLAAWRQALGLTSPAVPPPADGADWAPPKRSAEIPVFYSRLFAGQARWAGDVLNVPEAEVRRAREALTLGPVAKVVALIGADAAGRGAMVGTVLRGGKPPKRLAFTHPTTVEQLRAALADVGPAPVIQLSGIYWLMAARPRGFEPLHALLDLIAKEERRAAWLLEVDELVWDFACAATPLGEVFFTQVRLPAFTAAGLEQAILARHQLSGYELRFALGGPEESLGADRGPARDRYFQALHEASGGLLQVALPIWLASIGRVAEDSGVVVVAREPRAPALDRLSLDAWTVLFLVARQGWIDPTTLAFVLQTEVTSAEGRLAGLAGLGLLERQGRDAFVIRRHLRGAVLGGLRRLGWLAR